MSDFRITFTNADGGLSIIIPAPGASVDDAAKAVPAGVQYKIVNKDDLPADRTFRDAWVQNGPAIEHDMDKARAIAHQCRRAARAAEFAPLDVEATIPARALKAEEKRQAIRDRYDAMQAEINAAADVDVLKATIAAVL